LEEVDCFTIYLRFFSGKYAFFANKEYIIYRLQDVLPLDVAMDIVDTGKDFLVRGIGFGLQKNSPYRNVINHVSVYIVYSYNWYINIVRYKCKLCNSHIMIRWQNSKGWRRCHSQVTCNVSRASGGQISKEILLNPIQRLGSTK